MIRYFVTQITTINGQTAIGTFEFDDINKAKSYYYQALASTYANEGLEYAMIYIMNEYGNKEAIEIYKKPYEPEPTPEPTE